MIPVRVRVALSVMVSVLELNHARTTRKEDEAGLGWAGHGRTGWLYCSCSYNIAFLSDHRILVMDFLQCHCTLSKYEWTRVVSSAAEIASWARINCMLHVYGGESIKSRDIQFGEMSI